MKKKLVSVLLAFVFLLVLTGCGAKEITAEDLLGGVVELDAEKYQDMLLTMHAKTEADEQEVSLDLIASVEMRQDILHIYDMTMYVGMPGLNMDVSMEGWLDKAEQVTYMNINALGQESGWTKSASDEAARDFDFGAVFTKISESDGAVLQEHVKGEDYVVTWDLDKDVLGDALAGMTDVYDTYGDFDFSDAVGKMTFDEVSKELRRVGIEGEGFSFELLLNTINGDTELGIPGEIIDAAVEEFDEPADYEIDYVEPDDYYFDDSSYDYSGDGGEVTSDGEGYDDFIDPLAVEIAAADPTHRGVYVYHYDGMTSLQYDAGGEDWMGSVTVQRSDPEVWGKAESAFNDQVDWFRTWYGADPVSGSVEEQSCLFAKNNDGDYEMDLAAWNDDVLIVATLYTFNDWTADDAVDCLNNMLAVAGM